MLNILLATETSGGGTGRHMLDLAKEFNRLGHRSHLIYAPNRAERSFIQEIDTLCAQDGITASSCAIERSPGLSDIDAMRRLRAQIVEHGPFDILHGHSSKAGALLRLLPRKLGPRVYTPHALKVMDPEAGRLSKLLYGAIEAGLGRFASDALIAVSPMEQDTCVSLGIPIDRVHLVINGVPSEITDTPGPTRAELGLAEDLHVFGYVGRFANQKAPERLVQAFVRLDPAARAGLLMVGDGPGRAEMEAQIAEAGLSDRVHFAGLTSALPYYQSMDSFVLPSRFESMPYVLLEAAEFGLPILATDVSGTDLMVTQGENGLLLPNSDDPATLSDAMTQALDPARHAAFRAAAREKIGRYSLSNMAKDTLAVYETVIDANKASGRSKGLG